MGVNERNERYNSLSTFKACELSVEDEWLESTRNRALSIDGGPMWI
jgi:hypothetical protein